MRCYLPGLGVGVGLALGLLTGCGGGGGAVAPPVRVNLAIQWPERTRASATAVNAPESAQSAVVTFAGAGAGGHDAVGAVDRGTVDAAQATGFPTTFVARPGAWPMTARFYAQPGGAGALVALASLLVRVAPDGSVTRPEGSPLGPLQLGETIRTVTISAGQVFHVGQPAALQYAALDAQGRVVATAPDAAQIRVASGERLIAVATDNRLVGLLPGTASIAVTIDHAACPITDVRVVANAPLAIAPGYADIGLSDVVQFTAATGDGGQASVEWSILEGAAGGSIDPTGRYSAPATAGGPYHVVATDQTDRTRQAVATVRVTAVTISFGSDDGRVRTMLAMSGTGATVSDRTMRQPHALAVDSSGRIYAVDAWTASVVRLDDALGQNPVRFGAKGGGQGQFRTPSGIAIDAQGRIYVADSDNNRIVRIDNMTGDNWVEFGAAGPDAGHFSAPKGIVLDGSGRIYVCDSGNRRIVRMDDMSGRNWTALGVPSTGSAFSPVAACLGPDGTLYVAGGGSGCIVRVDDFDGGHLTRYGDMGSRPGQFGALNGIQVDALGRIYVIDGSNRRVVRMDDMHGANLVSFDVTSFPSGPANTSAPWGLLVR